VYLPVSAIHIVKHIDRMLTTTLAFGFRVSGLDCQVAHSDLGRPWPAGSALIALINLHLCMVYPTLMQQLQNLQNMREFQPHDVRRPPHAHLPL